MTTTPRPVSRRRGVTRTPGRPQRGVYVRFPLGVALALLGLIFVVSGLVDLFDDGDVTVRFLVAGTVSWLLGYVELRRVPRPSVTSAPAVMTMATLAYVFLIAGGAFAHILGDATDDVDGAIFESAAAGTTTAMTGLDSDTLSMGMHMFRALMQWSAGLGALAMAWIVIPLLLGGREVRGRRGWVRGERALITGRTRGARNLLGLYVAGTVVMVVGFLAAGLGVFDAVAHAMATVSTGGLSTRTGSLAAFDSAAVEWVAAGGMAIAGLSLAVAWSLLRRERNALARSSELKVYVIVMLASIFAIGIAFGDDYGGAEAFRSAILAVTSAMSTTGFTSTGWWSFAAGAQTLLLVLLGIGAMSGSAGGGFGYARVLQAFRFARRELKRQLHPSVVDVVRVGGEPVSERDLERMTAYVVVFTLAVAAGGMLIELGDSDVSPGAALSLSISALSTAGPQVIDPVALGDLGPVSKLSMATLMLLGRLSILTVVLTVFNAAVRASAMVGDTMRRES